MFGFRQQVGVGRGMKVLVCGGRDFENWWLLSAEMTRLLGEQKIDAIIHGGAKGADTMAGEFANGAGIQEIVFKADWKKYGRRAGPMRNQQMIDEGKPDLAVAFPGGRGTADMVTRASEVIEHEIDGVIRAVRHDRGGPVPTHTQLPNRPLERQSAKAGHVPARSARLELRAARLDRFLQLPKVRFD